MTTNPQTVEEMNEFPKGKDNYCPKCYFDDDVTILKSDCKHHQKDMFWVEWGELIESVMEAVGAIVILAVIAGMFLALGYAILASPVL